MSLVSEAANKILEGKDVRETIKQTVSESPVKYRL